MQSCKLPAMLRTNNYSQFSGVRSATSTIFGIYKGHEIHTCQYLGYSKAITTDAHKVPRIRFRSDTCLLCTLTFVLSPYPLRVCFSQVVCSFILQQILIIYLLGKQYIRHKKREVNLFLTIVKSRTRARAIVQCVGHTCI